MFKKLTIVISITAIFSSVFADDQNSNKNKSNSFKNDTVSQNTDKGRLGYFQQRGLQKIQLGPRPFFLVNNMEPSSLKRKLKGCGNHRFKKTDFSIGHRGAALQFLEHTRESYIAAARMGAGIIECDVTFTKDKELVCRHSQCDLHTTTNILTTPLAEKCSVPFSPAVKNPETGDIITPAKVKCCTSDISLAEFKTLRGIIDASNPAGTTIAEFMNDAPNFLTDLYSVPTSGTLMTHVESIDLFKKLNVKMTPELKMPSVKMPFDSDGDGVGDYSQEDYAQQMIDEYKSARVRPRKVYAQSFNLNDVLFWLKNEPDFGRQAVFLENINPTDSNPDNDQPPTLSELQKIHAQGVNIIAPPMSALVTLDSENNFTPSQYALDTKSADLRLITWTLERSGILGDENNGGDTYELLDVLAQEVGIKGIFSDHPATVTYYANCMGL